MPEVQPSSDGSGLRLVVLGSGSRGNSVLVESAGHRLLIDAGFACRELEARLRSVGVEAADLDAVVLTHEHSDHCRGVERLARRHRLPVWATAGTMQAKRLRRVPDLRELPVGGRCEIAGMRLESFAVPHDAREPVGLVLEGDDGTRVGLVADLGARSRSAWARLIDLDLLLVEANHDVDLLRRGPYPWYLKRRIASRFGHLSNEAAATGVAELVGDRLQTIVLYHLSETNNLPALAVEAVGEAVDRMGSRARLVVSEQGRPTGWLGPETTADGPSTRLSRDRVR